jgi:hypothetical protein
MPGSEAIKWEAFRPPAMRRCAFSHRNTIKRTRGTKIFRRI